MNDEQKKKVTMAKNPLIKINRNKMLIILKTRAKRATTRVDTVAAEDKDNTAIWKQIGNLVHAIGVLCGLAEKEIDAALDDLSAEQMDSMTLKDARKRLEKLLFGNLEKMDKNAKLVIKHVGDIKSPEKLLNDRDSEHCRRLCSTVPG
jgi:hypothetical protein